MNTKALIIAIGAAALGLVLLLLYKQRFEAEASGGVPVRVLIADRPEASGLPPQGWPLRPARGDLPPPLCQRHTG